jgi:ribokinase
VKITPVAKPRILVVGSSNTDMIIKLDRIPRPGETILGGEFATAAGGKGANQAVAATRAGGRVTFIARVGRDMFGDQAVAGFRQDRINVQYIVRDPAAPSGVALIFVARDGENSIAVAGGANARLTPADVKRAKAAIASARLVVLQLETPLNTVTAAAQLAAKVGAAVILNPAPARPLPDLLLKHVFILTPNEHEAEVLTGIKVKDEAAASKAAAGLRARGAFVADGERTLTVPGFKVKAVDTTAAWDVFNGTLAVALAEGQKLMEAVRFANAAAAISATRLGAQPSAPNRREIESFLAQKG